MEMSVLLRKLSDFFKLYISRKFTGELRVTVHMSEGGIAKLKFGYEETVNMKGGGVL